MGYVRVDPDKVPLQGYATDNVPGTGRCYVLQDVILMEIPAVIAEQYRKEQEREIREEQQERQGRLARADEEMEREFNKRGQEKTVSIARGYSEDYETFNNPINEEQAALARSVAAMQKLNPRAARDLPF